MYKMYGDIYDTYIVERRLLIMEKSAFWNNKGGTGKKSLAFQIICCHAQENPEKRVPAIDVCPQASIGGYFQLRLPSPYTPPTFCANDFLTRPHDFNVKIPTNIDLLCGDPLLELQANAISTLANNQIPGTNTWISIIDWFNDFLEGLRDAYDVVFFDANPSFSIYTQIALAASEKLMLPVMADDSSRRAIQNAFSLIYGLKLPYGNIHAVCICREAQGGVASAAKGSYDSEKSYNSIHGTGIRIRNGTQCDRQ